MREFLKNELELESPDEIDNIVFDRVHRLGPKRLNSYSYPRPVVAKFEKFRDREKFRKAGIDLNKKRCGYNIREHFPIEMEERRKKLYPVMHRFQRNPDNKVVLVRDRLYINDQLYVDENTEQTALK